MIENNKCWAYYFLPKGAEQSMSLIVLGFLSMVAYAFSTQEAEVGGSLWVGDQCSIHSEAWLEEGKDFLWDYPH